MDNWEHRVFKEILARTILVTLSLETGVHTENVFVARFQLQTHIAVLTIVISDRDYRTGSRRYQHIVANSLKTNSEDFQWLDDVVINNSYIASLRRR